MAERASYAAYVQLLDAADTSLYEGEAIYRPERAHPISGESVPQVGIPDDAMSGRSGRPHGSEHYRLWLNGELIAATGVYLERVSTCWWFLLEHAPRHAPSA